MFSASQRCLMDKRKVLNAPIVTGFTRMETWRWESRRAAVFQKHSPFQQRWRRATGCFTAHNDALFPVPHQVQLNLISTLTMGKPLSWQLHTHAHTLLHTGYIPQSTFTAAPLGLCDLPQWIMYRLIYCHAVKPRTVKSIGGVSVKLVNSYVACQVPAGLTGQFKSRFLGLCVTLHEEELGGKGGTWRCQ